MPENMTLEELNQSIGVQKERERILNIMCREAYRQGEKLILRVANFNGDNIQFTEWFKEIRGDSK